jgi:hypothetical protein
LSWAEQKLVFAEDNLKRLIPDAALIRVSTPLSDDASALADIDDFVREMVAVMAAPTRPVLVA